MREDLPADVPFSLACEGCDGGMEVESYEQALADGWTDICYTPELLTANFLGLCPVCRQRQEAEQRARSGRPASE